MDIEVEEGTVKLGDKNFEILSLEGHSIGQIGVATEDKVLFCGRCIFQRRKNEEISVSIFI